MNVIVSVFVRKRQFCKLAALNFFNNFLFQYTKKYKSKPFYFLKMVVNHQNM